MWNLNLEGEPPLWRVAPSPEPFVLASSTRLGGVSVAPYHALNLGRSTADRPEAVAENRRRMLAAVGIPADRVVTAGQVHGARVVRVEEPGHQPECDALLTTRTHLALAVTTADCMPLLFSAPGAVAVAHAGWRGTAAGIAPLTLAALCEASGVGPDRVHVAIGPCIRVGCYEVGQEVASSFPAAAVREGTPRPFLDLPRAARLQLINAGVPADAIHDCGACTACEPERYFSYRRDGPVSGRHWSVAARLG